MKNHKDIQLASDLSSFFAEEVQTIARKQGVEMSPYTSAYLASVLARFTDAKSYLVQKQTDHESALRQDFPTLALLFLETNQSPANEQFHKLLHLGDVALFTSGFFGERVLRNSLDMDYYVAMGGMAYERAGHIRETIASERAINVYFELAKSFKDFVDVFAELSDQSLLANDKDVIKLYEKWLDQPSHRVGRMLGEIGVIASGGSKE